MSPLRRMAVSSPPAGAAGSPGATHAAREPRPGADFSRLPAQGAAPLPSDRLRGALGTERIIGANDDPLELDADHVADQVLAPARHSVVRDAPRPAQTLAGHGPAGTTGAPDSVEQVLAGSGRPMGPALERDMGRRFGRDFSHVRIHTGTMAEQSARDVHANAYTVGDTIVFGAGQFAPQTGAGRRVIAHELTHVAQLASGSSGTIMRDDPKRRPTTIDFDEEDEAAKKPGSKAKPPAAQPKAAATPSSTADDGTLFFQNPKVAGDPNQPDRNRVFVEPQLTKVGPSVNLRFAYPASEFSSGNPSSKVTSAKKQIGTVIGEVIADIGTYSNVPKTDERRIQQERARLGEAYRGLTTSKPLNIFIATLPSPAELLSDRYIPYTDRVYIDAKDVGNRAKLEAAIRLPLQNLVGGSSARTGKDLPANSKADLKNTLLHEALHAMLIAKGVGSDAQWGKLKGSGKFKITGPADAQAKGEELVRKFLIAQDEVFVYESVAMLYPPVAPVKGDFDLFIKNAELLLTKKGAAISTSRQTISVSEKVAKKAVPWTITYRTPGSFTLVAADTQLIDLILTVYPNQF
jgi:hypothetical protein